METAIEATGTPVKEVTEEPLEDLIQRWVEAKGNKPDGLYKVCLETLC